MAIPAHSRREAHARHGIRAALAVGSLLLALGLLSLAPALAAPPPDAVPLALDAAPRLLIPSPAHAPEKWPADPGTINGYLFRPAGSGPFAAVVLLHGSAGFRPGFVQLYRPWIERLLSWGYVVLLADSFEGRGFRSLEGAYLKVDPATERPQDAYAALRFLHAQPFVDASRIGVMGWSHGGWTVLHLLEPHPAVPPPGPTLRFKAAVALYPWCGRHEHSDYVPSAPLLILIGAADDWTPAVHCERLRAESSASAAQLRLKIYPGATHAFDAHFKSILVRGHRVEHHPEAERDAVEQVRAFLAERL